MANKETKIKKENNKNKKSFFKDFKAELKKVNWPTPKQLLNNTVAVITIVLITAVIVFVLDIVFETLNKQGINKIKEVVGTNTTAVEDENTTTDETTEDISTEGEEVQVEDGTESNVDADTETDAESGETTENSEDSGENQPEETTVEESNE